jgi:hypothetical protein
MTQQPPYTTNDLLLLIGQCTVELAYLRAQVAMMQQRLNEFEAESPNGRVKPEVSSAFPG